MSQDRISGEIVFICDECDETLETDTGNFTEANEMRQDEDWRAFLVKGEWNHTCPDCS